MKDKDSRDKFTEEEIRSKLETERSRTFYNSELIPIIGIYTGLYHIFKGRKTRTNLLEITAWTYYQIMCNEILHDGLEALTHLSQQP